MSTEATIKERTDNQILLKEYECAQSSAEHHDSLLWQTTAIVWGANTLLLGYALGSMGSKSAQPLLPFIAILGILMARYVLLLKETNNWVMNQKYRMCREIELRLGMKIKQHTWMNENYPKRAMQRGYDLLSFLFQVTWLLVLLRGLAGTLGLADSK